MLGQNLCCQPAHAAWSIVANTSRLATSCCDLRWDDQAGEPHLNSDWVNVGMWLHDGGLYWELHDTGVASFQEKVGL